LDLTSSINDTWFFKEPNGRVYVINSGSDTTPFNEMKVNRIDVAENSLAILKKELLAFCSFVYNQNGTFYFIDRISKTPGTLDFDSVLSIKKIPALKIDLVEVTKTERYAEILTVADNDDYAYKHQFWLGNTASISNRTYRVDLTGNPEDLLEKTGRYYIEQYTGSTPGQNEFYPEPQEVPTETMTSSYTFVSGGFLNTGAETDLEQGMWMQGEGIAMQRVVLSIESDTKFLFAPSRSLGDVTSSDEPDVTKVFNVERFESESVVRDSPRNLYKTGWVCQTAGEKYSRWFQTQEDELELTFDHFWHTSASVDFEDLNWAISKIRYKFEKFNSVVRFRAIGDDSGSWGTHNWDWESRSTFDSSSLVYHELAQ